MAIGLLSCFNSHLNSPDVKCWPRDESIVFPNFKQRCQPVSRGLSWLRDLLASSGEVRCERTDAMSMSSGLMSRLARDDTIVRLVVRRVLFKQQLVGHVPPVLSFADN